MNDCARRSWRDIQIILEGSPLRALALLAAGLGLSSCADTSTIHYSYYNSAYTTSHVDLAAASGQSLAVIRSNPFPEDIDNRGVVAAMQGRNFGQKMYFAQVERPDDKYGYKVILDFSGQRGGYDQCAQPPSPAAQTKATGEISVLATFCVGDLLLTDALGSTGGATGPDDPRFQQLIGDIMVALTPPYIPDRHRHCPMRRC
jgi:hypothetical protein